MKPANAIWVRLYWLATAAAFAVVAAMAAFYAPVEATMGVVQKIFYVHLPSALNTFAAFAVVFVAGIGYLSQRRAWWDDLAASAARAALCSARSPCSRAWSGRAPRGVRGGPGARA